MTSNWEEKSLSELLEINPKTELRKGTVAKKVAMEHVFEFTKKIQGYIIEEFKSGSKFRNGDTLMARITPCLENGKTAFVDILDNEEVAFGSTEFFVLRALKDKGDPQYIYYLAISDLIRTVTIKSMTGTSGRQRAQKESILEHRMLLPSIKIQKKIGGFLAKFDEKIEINKLIIRNLKELSQTLFKRWFIDFEFPNEEGQPYKSSGGKMVDSELGEIPEQWSVVAIKDIDVTISDHVANGSFKALKENVVVKEEEDYALFLRNVDLKNGLSKDLRYVTKESYEFLKKSRLYGNEVIISNVGDVGTIHRCPKLDKPMVLGNNQIFINSNRDDGLYNTFLYLFFCSNLGLHLIDSITSGSVQMKFNKTDLRNSKIILPDEKSLQFIEQGLGVYLDMLEILNQENKKLDQLRDSLLPKLLSGEIEILEESVVD